VSGRRSIALAIAAVLIAFLAAPAEAARKKTKKKRRTATPARTAAWVAAPRPPDPSRVTIRTGDGINLAASWKELPSAPAVLLVHDFSRDRRQWAELADALRARGLSTLALDLRSHGESGTARGSRPGSPSPSLLKDPNGFPRDVEAACVWLRGRAGKVGVMGLSVGANLAILATASGWADTAVAISASTERLGALAGKRPTAPRSLLVLAAEADPGRATSAQNLLQAASEPKGSRLFPGAAHNLDLLTQHPEALEAALSWLADRLEAVPPPSPVMAIEPVPMPTAAPAETPGLSPAGREPPRSSERPGRGPRSGPAP
jgi:alpha-beta hydrolase superfamily lysophospholipase